MPFVIAYLGIVCIQKMALNLIVLDPLFCETHTPVDMIRRHGDRACQDSKAL